MKKNMLTVIVALALLFMTIVGTQNIEVANANPVSVYSVPDILISFPTASIGGYVNSTVEYQIYVNMFVDSPALDSIFYSLDGQPPVELKNLKTAIHNDLVYAGLNIEKMEFKRYTANLIFENLSEGTHILEAYASNMSDTQSFTVNSHFIVAELKTLSPTSQTYFNPTIPLTFNINGETNDAHYYLYKLEPASESQYESRILVSDQALKENTTLGYLSEGNYELLLFATTEQGQASEKTPFSVSNNLYLKNLHTIVGSTVLIGLIISIGSIAVIKKRKKKKE
jgi:hypothetical protein